MRLVLLGAPGAGKGTQAEQLVNKYHIPQISTGHLIRKAIADKTPAGMAAQAYIDRGELVPDQIVVDMVRERLKEDDCKNGYILDGFPRTLAQAEMMEELSIPVDVVLEIEVDEETIVDRLSGRRVCGKCGATYHVRHNPPKKEDICDQCGEPLTRRADDMPEIIRNRMEVYRTQTAPLENYYQEKGLLVTVRGRENLQETVQAVTEALESKMVEAGL